MKKKKDTIDLTKGSVAKGIVAFTIPLIFGQLLQQLYNMADAWVVGNFADNTAFAAVSTSGSLVFLVVGMFNGIAIGGGVVISRYVGAEDEKNIERSIHTNILFGIIAIGVDDSDRADFCSADSEYDGCAGECATTVTDLF